MTDDAASLHTTVANPPAIPKRLSANSLMHSGITASRFIGMHAMGVIFPVSAGLVLFGWRALGAIAVVFLSTMAALLAWRQVGLRGEQLRYDHGAWLAVLLAMTLPAHLFGGTDPTGTIPLWPILAAGGIVLVIFTWLLGGIGSGRVHPVLVTHLLLFICFRELLVPQFVLQRQNMVLGDLLQASPAPTAVTVPWIRSNEIIERDSLQMEPASQALPAYTRAFESPNVVWISLEALLRDHMPPLEDLIIGGHPAPIGLGSSIAIIIGGLFMLYRGLIDYRVPLIIILSAAAAMMILPVPVVISETESVWRWFIMRKGVVGWEIGLTLVNYELMAGPLMFMAFFLATTPAVRPIARRARVAFALLAGVLTAVFQLYLSVAIGAYLGLLAASSITPFLDRLFKPRTLV